jgi:hypothetical protein
MEVLDKKFDELSGLVTSSLNTKPSQINSVERT